MYYKEKWKYLDNEDCFISNYGRIKLEPMGDILQPTIPKREHWYLTVQIRGKCYSIHRLAAEAFLNKIPGKLHVNHKDGNKQNNKSSNLEWCSQSENMKHAWKNNYIKNIPDKTLSMETVNNIRMFKKNNPGVTQLKIAKLFNISQGFCSNILNNKKYITQ